jgi:hypothetical protein
VGHFLRPFAAAVGFFLCGFDFSHCSVLGTLVFYLGLQLFSFLIGRVQDDPACFLVSWVAFSDPSLCLTLLVQETVSGSFSRSFSFVEDHILRQPHLVPYFSVTDVCF